VVATAAGGLRLFDGRAWSVVGADQGLPAAGATALAPIGSVLAVGTGGGLCRLEADGLDCSWRERDARLRAPILALAGSADGGRLFVLTPRWVGFVEGDRLTVLADGLDLGAEPGEAAIGVDRAGTVYFGTSRRAYAVDPDDGRVKALGTDQGLPGEGVLSVLPDREGGVWIGGLRGLARIGTRRFLSFDQRDGLAENEVSAVVEAAPGRFLLGHNGALTLLTEDGGKPRRLWLSGSRGASDDRVLDLAGDAAGTVWAAAQSAGLLEVGGDGRVRAHHPSPRVVSVEVDRRGRLWVLGHRDLLVRRPGGFDRIELGPGLREVANLRWLATGLGGRLYLATDQGLWWRDGLEQETPSADAPWLHARGPTADSNEVYAVLDEPGSVWVGTRGGLLHVEGERLVAEQGAPALRQPIYALLRDPPQTAVGVRRRRRRGARGEPPATPVAAPGARRPRDQPRRRHRRSAGAGLGRNRPRAVGVSGAA
jgi:ligand-binding sensor domain-containing protein